MSKAYFFGVDIGTQGARVVLLDEKGRQWAAKEAVFPLNESSREEQSPGEWWQCCCQIIPEIVNEIGNDISIENIKAVAVTSTSGTIIPVDRSYNPLHPAIMYSDPRCSDEAELCKQIAAGSLTEGYTAFNVSSGLPKMRWFLNRFADRTPLLYKFIHASDFITGRLCGEYNVTDYTNALKSGYNVHQHEWPSYITDAIGIRKEWLQVVKPSGVPIGTLNEMLCTAWGLPKGIAVTTGMTDGCASQVASGAVSPGDWNTTIGTTLVVKGVTRREIIDPSGAIYNHRHPAGYWMPGGASNTGADWVSKLFAGADLAELGARAGEQLPATSLAWPLMQAGERFPFFAPHAVGFWPEKHNAEAFAACMEGVAFIERLAYDNIAELSGEPLARIFSAGGGSNSDTWLRIRSSIMNRPICKMQNVSGAAGAAILAASNTFYKSLQEAASAMSSVQSTFEPQADLVIPYEKKYKRFIHELRSRRILE